MFKFKRFLSKENPVLKVFLCMAISALSIILLSLAFAFVANISKDPTGNLGLFSLAALIISGAIGGFTSAKIKKDSAVIFSALIAVGMALIMMILCVIINGKVSGGSLMNYLCYIGVSTVFSVWGSKEKKHRHRKR